MKFHIEKCIKTVRGLEWNKYLISYHITVVEQF